MSSEVQKPVIFLAFANDRLEGARYLRNLAQEARRIREALTAAAGLCQLEVRQNTTIDEVLDVFQQYRNRIAVFHYGGHANGFNLLLESASGQPQAASAGGLAGFLGQQSGLQLVFLNGCSTEGHVDGLLRAGVSSVIATTESIDDAVATDLSSRFYRGLAHGEGVQTAFNEAVSAVKMARGNKPRDFVCWDDDTATAATAPSLDRWPWILRPRDGCKKVLDWNLPETVDNPLFGTPDPPDTAFPVKPFQHLHRFTRAHARIFFGRGYQIRRLYQKVTDPHGSPIILLYGQSGVGKSSLLDAGVVPRLGVRHSVGYVRREEDSLLDTLQLALFEQSNGMGIGEAWLAREQAEERPFIVILDQVEAVFTQPIQHQSEELDTFLEEINTVFQSSDHRPRGKLMLSFRKEWLPEIQEALEKHRLQHTDVFLEPLDRRGVLEAVRLSDDVREHYGLQVEDELPDTIATDLLADKESAIAPTLQVLLSRMYDAAKEASQSSPCFDQSLYSYRKKHGLHLSDFLDQQLTAIQKLVPKVVGSGLALDVLVFHTTELSTSKQQTEENLRESYGHVWDQVEQFVRYCKDHYLLVDASSDRSDTRKSTCLTHDTLAPLVRRRFDESDLPGQRARRILDARSRDWKEGKRGAELDEADLTTVEDGQSGTRRWSPEEERLVSASRAARDKQRRARKTRRAAAVAAVALITALGVVSSWKWMEAEANFEKAETARKEAVAAHAATEAAYKVARPAVDATFQIFEANFADRVPAQIRQKELLNYVQGYYAQYAPRVKPIERAQVHYHLGRIHELHGRTEEAQAEFAEGLKCLTAQEFDASKILASGLTHDAITLLSKIFTGQGRLAWDTGRLPEAAAAFEAALELREGLYVSNKADENLRLLDAAYRNLEIVVRESGHHERADKLNAQAKKLSPTIVRDNQLGEAQKRFEDARQNRMELEAVRKYLREVRSKEGKDSKLSLELARSEEERFWPPHIQWALGMQALSDVLANKHDSARGLELLLEMCRLGAQLNQEGVFREPDLLLAYLANNSAWYETARCVAAQLAMENTQSDRYAWLLAVADRDAAWAEKELVRLVWCYAESPDEEFTCKSCHSANDRSGLEQLRRIRLVQRLERGLKQLEAAQRRLMSLAGATPTPAQECELDNTAAQLEDYQKLVKAYQDEFHLRAQ